MTFTNEPMTPALTDLTRWMDGAGLRWRVVHHRSAASAVAEADALSRAPEMIGKTIVLVDRGELICVVVPASARVSAEKVRHVLGSPDAALAREDEIARAVPAYELGALPPCGPCVPPVKVIDERLLTYGHVLCAGGDRTTSLAIDPEELVTATGALTADISEPEEGDR
jgi:Cys-tRNA(Pro)/Cys-tRNA(Cys) deacylase